jgi:hypothetical protein
MEGGIGRRVRNNEGLKGSGRELRRVNGGCWGRGRGGGMGGVEGVRICVGRRGEGYRGVVEGFEGGGEGGKGRGRGRGTEDEGIKRVFC